MVENKMRKFKLNLFPKTLFFEFPNPRKNTKICCSNRGQKLLFTSVKTPESMEKFAPKIFLKNSCQRGIYRQIWKLAVGSRFCQNNPAGRSAGRPPNGQILTVASYRSTARVDRNKQRALLSAVSYTHLTLPTIYSV